MTDEPPLTRAWCIKLLKAAKEVERRQGDVLPSPTAHRGFFYQCCKDMPRVLKAYIELRLDFGALIRIVRARQLSAAEESLVIAIERDHARYLEGG